MFGFKQIIGYSLVFFEYWMLVFLIGYWLVPAVKVVRYLLPAN